MFQSLELKLGGIVSFGGDQKRKIIGSGTVGNYSLPSITNVIYDVKNQYVKCLVSVNEEQWTWHR